MSSFAHVFKFASPRIATSQGFLPYLSIYFKFGGTPCLCKQDFNNSLILTLPELGNFHDK